MSNNCEKNYATRSSSTMPNNCEKNYATRSSSKTSKKETKEMNDKVVDEEPVKKRKREKPPPLINRDLYHQKKIDQFFEKYPGEKEKMAKELPHLYTWSTGEVFTSDEEFTDPDSDDVLYVASDDELSDVSEEYVDEEDNKKDEDHEESASKESVTTSKDTKTIVSNTTSSLKKEGDVEDNKRINWSKGEHMEKLSVAVDDWLNNKGKAMSGEGRKLKLKEYCVQVSIPYKTLSKYVCKDPKKRRTVGQGQGPKPLLNVTDQEYVADVLARRDRSNKGCDMSEAVDLVMELTEVGSRKRAYQHVKKVILPNYGEVVKKKTVVAQKTTTNRTQITIKQQYRWHCTYDNALNELHKRNTGLCKLSRKPFKEVAHYFISGGDETCFMACPDGNVKVIGCSKKRKHEKRTNDSRASITMYRTGCVSGETGPTVFLLKGQRKRDNYTDDFLVKFGCRKGSTIIMTPNAFMTTEAWEKMTPYVCRGLREINPYVEANPAWYMIEIFDGFGAHMASLNAMKHRLNHRILSLKEEGDTSHVNQAYDKFVAKTDKKTRSYSVGVQRECKYYNKGVVDQWGLVHSGLMAVREVNKSTWTNSFAACNLDPRTRVSFPSWCEKIQQFLLGGESFKTDIKSDKYSLLPSLWRNMESEKKKSIYNIVKTNGGWTVKCLNELKKHHNIPMKDLQNIRICVECADENPDHLERNCDGNNATNVEGQNEIFNNDDSGYNKKINEGLKTFQLKPKGLKREDLFEHMIRFREIHAKKEGSNTPKPYSSPSEYLQVEFSEDNRKIVEFKRDVLAGKNINAKRHIIEDTSGKHATTKIARRKLDAIGNIKSHGGLVNDPESIIKLENRLQLAESISFITVKDKTDKEKKSNKEYGDLVEIAPKAFKKLFDTEPKKLTKKELRSVLLCSYNVDLKESQNNKTAYIDRLEREKNENPEMLNRLKDKDESFFQLHMSEYLKLSKDENNEDNDDQD